MPEKVFKKINVTGCSTESYEQAIRAAIAKAGESLHGMAWFEVTEMRGALAEGAVTEFQATVEVAFRVD